MNGESLVDATALLRTWAEMKWPRGAGDNPPLCTPWPKLCSAAEASLSAPCGDHSDFWRGRTTVHVQLEDGDRPDRMLIGDVVGAEASTTADGGVALIVEVPHIIDTLEDEGSRHLDNDILRHYHFVPADPTFPNGRAFGEFLGDGALQRRIVDDGVDWRGGPVRLSLKGAIGFSVPAPGDDESNLLPWCAHSWDGISSSPPPNATRSRTSSSSQASRPSSLRSRSGTLASRLRSTSLERTLPTTHPAGAPRYSRVDKLLASGGFRGA